MTFWGRSLVDSTCPLAGKKVDTAWFDKRRVNSNSLRSSTSEQLNIMPVCRVEGGAVVGHKRCFTFLSTIFFLDWPSHCGPQGPSGSMVDLPWLRQSIIDHDILFDDLYPRGVKP